MANLPKPSSSTAILLLLALLAGPPAARAQPVKDGPAPPGLWVGEVTLNGVATLDSPSNVVATVDTTGFRILLHVDAKGTTQLLKDVSIATVTNVAGVASTVLATDLTAAGLKLAQRDGRPLIRRLGTVAYDWDGTGAVAHRKVMDAGLRLYSSSYIVLTNGPANQTNPFRHPFRTGHENGLTFIRRLEISPSSGVPADPEKDGVLSISGTYAEQIRGILPLNNAVRPAQPTMLRASGTITLRRVSDIATID